jgi:hypothetical protein
VVLSFAHPVTADATGISDGDEHHDNDDSDAYAGDKSLAYRSS